MGNIRSYAKKFRRTYTVYTIGCAVVWAILLTALEAKEPSHRMGYLWCVFGGWTIGWVSATIARFVYPPPKKWFPNNAD